MTDWRTCRCDRWYRWNGETRCCCWHRRSSSCICCTCM